MQVHSNQDIERYKLHRRFDRMGRLVGDQKMAALQRSHVMILGMGGVGSWAAESILRSGVGEITLVDFDSICITNFNRQLHAINGMVGSSKTKVMAERMQQINPGAQIHAFDLFYNAQNSDRVFARRPDYVIDAIDNMTAKAHLIDHCKRNAIPLVTSTGSGGRLDPTRIKLVDLAFTSVDPLARELRKILRQKYGFPLEGEPFGVTAVYSDEPYTDPMELQYDRGEGFRCVCPQGDNPFFQCEKRNVIMGNAGFVTGAFGLACASVAVRELMARGCGHA